MRITDRSCSLAAASVLALALGGCMDPVAAAPPQVPGQYPAGQYPQQQGYAPGQYPQQPGQYQPQQGYAPGQYPQPQGQYPQPPGQYPQQAPAVQYGPYQPPSPQPPQQAPAPQQGYALPGLPSFPLPPPGYSAAPGQADPINTVDIDYLRATAKGVLGELVAALPAPAQAKVAGIPFMSDTTVGEINAYAACDENRMPRMAITDGLLQVEAYMAQLQATDEVFGTHKLDSYLQVLARDLKPQQPIVAPQDIDPRQHTDPRKVARQHQLLEEQLSFVLGHELGHHWLGHTGCANGQSGDRAITTADLGRVFVSKVAPVMNQQNENDADGVGVDDLLTAGARRPGYHWTERGAEITLSFFARLHKMQDSMLANVAIALLSSHPEPQARLPKIREEASRFRSSGTWYQPKALPMIDVPLLLPGLR